MIILSIYTNHNSIIIFSLVKRLSVCEELDDNACGSILFYAQLNPPGY